MNRHPRVILLTGFPRQATRLSLERFLSEGCTVYLLVPPEHKENAETLVGDRNARVLTGKTSAIDLGLSGPEVQELQKSIEEVHHLEDVVEGVASTLSRVLIEGTRSLLEFSLDLTRLRRFVHYSSVFASGWQRGLVVSNQPGHAPIRWHNTYEKCRWKAEAWCRAAMPKLPVTIVRTGLVVGAGIEHPLDDTERSFHLLKRFVNRSKHIPLPLPDGGRHPIHICPTDYLIEMTHSLVHHPGSCGGAFHVTDPSPPTALQVLTELGGRLRTESSSFGDALTTLITKLPGTSSPPGGIYGYASQEVWFELGATRATIEGFAPPCHGFTAYAEVIKEAIGKSGS